MKATWAKRCDGWVAFSTKTDYSIPGTFMLVFTFLTLEAIEIHHEGPEEYNNMWQKVFEM
jgi:glycoprotein-N-acetylgalactosamine 3-beta-galactosyltransferase